MYSKPDSPLSIGGVLDDGIKLFKACFMKVIGLSIISGLLSQAPSLFMPVGADPEQVPDFSSTFFLLTFALAPISLIFYGAIIAMVNAVANNEELKVLPALGIGVRRFFPLLFCGILFGLAVMGGFLLLVIPGIILSISLGFALYIVVIDDQGPIEALKTSHNLVWGNWWRTLVLYSVILFILMALVLILSMAMGFLGGVMGGMQVVSLLVFALMTAAVYPGMYAMYLAVLNDLKLRKQGDDLSARMDSLEG